MKKERNFLTFFCDAFAGPPRVVALSVAILLVPSVIALNLLVEVRMADGSSGVVFLNVVGMMGMLIPITAFIACARWLKRRYPY